VSGNLADRTGRYWMLTIAGYALTAVCVPLLAVTPFLGSAGLVLAVVLILAERTGKAVRSPSKSALLAQAAGQVGLGRGFAVHKALDQIGAFAGPLVVAGLIALTGVVWPALAALAVPGAVAIGLLLWIRLRTPAADDHADTAPARDAGGWRSWFGADLPRRFFLFAWSAAAATAGLVTFGLISFHANRTGLIALAAVPLLYAAAMASEAVAALGSGWLFDRWHGRVLYALPVLGAAVPALVFTGSVPAIVIGTLLWGAATGVQDSTVKALVADLVERPRRATAYGVFAAFQGAAALAGGAVAGLLYEHSRTALLVVLGLTQLVALILLRETVHRTG
jgi:Major Facilitator Superfamily